MALSLVQGLTPEQSFIAFWSVYPRKVARKAALKAWMALSPDTELQRVIYDALDLQAGACQDLQYFPHAATWIRGERWTDETTSPTTELQPWQRKYVGLRKT